MEPEPQLSDEQWLLIADLFPDKPPSELGGRPRRAARECVEGILWVLRSGARWRDLPAHFPSPPTCWRRFKAWTDAGVWKVAWARLLRKLNRRGRIHWEETMADGTFASAKKGVCA
jgi:transposase